MKDIILIIFFSLTIQVVCGQEKEIDSLKNIIEKQSGDATEINALKKVVHLYFVQNQFDSENKYIDRGFVLARSLNFSFRKDSSDVIWLIDVAGMYRFSNPDSSIILAEEALHLAQQLNFTIGEGHALITLGENFRLIGDFPQGLGHLFNALRIGRNIGDHEMEENSLSFIGIAYIDLGEYRQGLNYLYQAEKIHENFPRNRIRGLNSFRLSYIGGAYEEMNMLDSALFFQQQALYFQQQLQGSGIDVPFSPLKATILTRLGDIQVRLGNQTQALSYYRDVIKIGDLLNLGVAQYQAAELFYTLNQRDSSLHYARLAFVNNQRALEKTWVLKASGLLAKLYKSKNNLDSAFHYQGIAMAMNDSLFGPGKFHKLELLAINEKQQQLEILERQKEIQHEKERFENKIKMVILLATIGVFLLLAIMLYRNNRRKQKTNLLLSEQKQKVEITLSELKSTQAQLIQSEKMASLGELTAGIAHEIQNPLNFVNNFSEVSNEILEEMKNELEKGNKEDAMTMVGDVKQNLEKILQHGKRADAIVKGMLQHSRSSSGAKEPTDINALCDEYLRLVYQGLRAKDKSFNAKIETDFDPAVGKINIVPQDIGRVVLNLINNAFYAVAERQKPAGAGTDGVEGVGYEPLVIVSTKKLNDNLEIKIKDTGNGIPRNIIDKIFQPFFTTKPTGQGTGLGLSLAYDIVKAHGGEIKVVSKEGEGSEFIIILPIYL